MRSFSRTSSRYQRGATRRQAASADRWLNRLLDIAVITALVVGVLALIITMVTE